MDQKAQGGQWLSSQMGCFGPCVLPATCHVHHHRGTMYRRLQQFDPAVEDFLKALDMVTDSQDSLVEKAQRQLLLTYNDFAVHCYTQGAYQEGVLLLNKAIRDEQNEKSLYINRGGELGAQALENIRGDQIGSWFNSGSWGCTQTLLSGPRLLLPAGQPGFRGGGLQAGTGTEPAGRGSQPTHGCAAGEDGIL